LEIVDTDDLGELSERPRVFVMWIQHNDVRIRMIGENGGQHQSNCAGFSRAGCAEHGEVLCQQFVDQHKCRASRIMVETANADVGD
jgi:hypothetical protein